MIVFNCIDELHQGLDDHWSKIRPEMKSVMARLRIFSQPGAPVVAMSATVTEEEVSSMVKNLGLREKPVILRASPVQDHHKYVVIKRPPNICGPDGYTDRLGREKPGLHPVLDQLYLAKFFECIRQKQPVKKCLMLFRTERQMLDVLEYVQEELPDFDNSDSPFVMNHAGIGPVTTKNIISRKNEISLYLSTSKMLMGVDIEQISVIIFVRVLNQMHYVLQGIYIALKWNIYCIEKLGLTGLNLVFNTDNRMITR